MKLAAYASPLTAYATPTGVGQHILGMFSALQARDDLRFGLITPRGKLDEGQKFIAQHPRSCLLPLPWPDRLVRLATTGASLLSLDPWLGDADWVYAPVEQPVTTRRKLAVTVHDLFAFEPPILDIPKRRSAGLSWRRRMKRILDRADLIATVSQFTKLRMLELFDVCAPERIVVIGNGGSEGFGPEPGADDSHILQLHDLQPFSYVLFPASLTWRKGGDFLLQVAALARARKVDLRFVVIGRRHDADLLAALEDTRARIPDIPIALLGYVSQRELAVLYRHARAALLPSRYEGFGIPVVEALASGCPLFISQHPALLEVAAGHAVVIEPDAASALAALVSHADSIARRIERVRAGCSRVWSRCASHLIEAMQ